MKPRGLTILFGAVLAACLLSAGPDWSTTPNEPSVDGGDAARRHLPAVPPAPSAEPRFEAVGVYIDPHGKPLAAYQFELVAEQGDVTLVGIQGGDHPAYSDPPYYDTHALLADRIVVAAFNTGSDLPANKTRIATLMVRVGGNIEPKYNAHLQVAASSDAKPIAADLTVEGVNP